MTGPNNPYDPYGQQPKDPYGQQPSNPYGQQPNSPYNQQPNYGYQQNPGYQQDPYGYQRNQGYAGGDPGVGVSQPGGELPPTSPVISGPGEYRVTGPLSTAFKRLNANFGIWLAYILLLFVLVFVSIFALMFLAIPDIDTLNAPVTSEVYSQMPMALILMVIVIAVISMVMSIFMYRGAFEEIDGRTPSAGTFFRVSRWGSIIGIFLLAGAISIALQIPGQLLQDYGLTRTYMGDPGGAMFALLGDILMFGLMLATAPIIALSPLAVIDGRASVFQSFGFIWNAVKPNYWKVLGTFIILGIIVFVSALLCGIGLIYTTPLAVITTVAMYRQVIGGRRPLIQA